MLIILLSPGRRAEYCDKHVCLCLSVSLPASQHISGTTLPIFTEFCADVTYGRISVLSGGVAI